MWRSKFVGTAAEDKEEDHGQVGQEEAQLFSVDGSDVLHLGAAVLFDEELSVSFHSGGHNLKSFFVNILIYSTLTKGDCLEGFEMIEALVGF